MNGQNLLMLLQKKMSDPNFQASFNKLAKELNKIPGLQQEVMKIASINDETKREKALEKLPNEAKTIVKKLINLLNT